jgi:ribosomal protein L11 methyltransferase
MNHLQVSIEANEQQQELLISLLHDLGATGFEQKDDRLLAYFNEENFPAYYVQSILAGYNFQTNTIPEQNWNEEWEKNFQPVVVDDFCAVRAHFHAPISTVKHEIIITPKMSFGTGHHATTYMMMQQMKTIDFNNKSVFDFGTGTGILAILAEKCGAKEIIAIDNDEWSYTNAKENVEMNNCKKIIIQNSPVLPEREFDIILANINRNIILEYLSQLKSISNEKTIYLFSGLLKDDEADINTAAKQQGLHLLKKMEKNNWICLLFNRGKRSLL